MIFIISGFLIHGIPRGKFRNLCPAVGYCEPYMADDANHCQPTKHMTLEGYHYDDDNGDDSSCFMLLSIDGVVARIVDAYII